MESKPNQDVKALKAHLALNVRNVESSIQFYQRMLGIDPSKVRRGYAKFDIQNPPLNLTLNEGSFTTRGALSHLGIQVASTADVLATRQRWMDSGLITRDEMQTNCCYATQDKTKGNLTTDEAKLIEDLLYELRMRYVQVQQGDRRIVEP